MNNWFPEGESWFPLKSSLETSEKKLVSRKSK
nr:MAG TPA: hypothetical protein [Caudoviricetes sp.]